MSEMPESFEEKKWRYELGQEHALRAHDQYYKFIDQLNEAAVKSGELTFRSTLIINGGAAVALLAFISGLASSGKLQPTSLASFSVGLMWFACGVVASAFGIGVSYLVNFFQSNAMCSKELNWDHPYIKDTSSSMHWMCARNVALLVAISAALAAIGFFVWGMLDIRNSIQTLKLG
jgi:hypothetical protein